MSLDLTSRLLSEEIRTLHALAKTGILEVSSRQAGKGIYFRAGQVVFASSSLEEDRLGESLIRLGRISRADFGAAYKLEMGKHKRRIGQALVGAGLISEDELGKLVSHQVESVILSLFQWTSGEMRFHETNDPVPTDLALDLSTHRLLLEGIRVYPDEARLLEALGDRRRKLRAARQAPFDYSRVPLSMVERTVLDEAGRGVRIADILAGPTPKPRLARALYALIASGLVEDAESELLLRPVVPEPDARNFRVAMPEPPAAPPAGAASPVFGPTPESGTPAAARKEPASRAEAGKAAAPPPALPTTSTRAPVAPAAPGGAPAAASPAGEPPLSTMDPDLVEARADLLRLYEALPRATHYAVLGLRPDVSAEDVAAAYARLTEDQDRRWNSLEKDPRLASAIFTLKLRRREANEALSDPRRRAAYDHSLGQMRPMHPRRCPCTRSRDPTRARATSSWRRAGCRTGARANAPCPCCSRPWRRTPAIGWHDASWPSPSPPMRRWHPRPSGTSWPPWSRTRSTPSCAIGSPSSTGRQASRRGPFSTCAWSWAATPTMPRPGATSTSCKGSSPPAPCASSPVGTWTG